MKISPNLHTNLTVLLQQKLLLQIFCSGKNNTSPPLFSAHQKTPPRLLYFLLTKKTLQHASLSLQKNQPHTAAAAHVFFPLKHKALMGLSGNGLKRIKIGLDPLYKKNCYHLLFLGYWQIPPLRRVTISALGCLCFHFLTHDRYR